MPIITGVDVWVEGRIISNLTEELDFNNATINDLDFFILELSQLPNLKRVELCGSNLSNEQMEILMNTYPNVKFVWNIILRSGGNDTSESMIRDMVAHKI